MPLNPVSGEITAQGINDNDSFLKSEIDTHKAEKATDDSLGHITLRQLGMRNVLINGSFDIWQRGTNIVGDDYVADRWLPDNVQTVQRSAETPSGSTKFSYNFHRNDGAVFGVTQRIESINATSLIGYSATLSFWAKRTDGDPNSVRARIYSADSVDDFSSQTEREDSGTFALSDTWQKYEYTFEEIHPECKNGIALYIRAEGHTSGGGVSISQVQLEPGDIATPFEHRPVGLELALCQRYFERIHGEGSGSDFKMVSLGYGDSGSFRGFLTYAYKRIISPSYEVSGDFTIRASGSNNVVPDTDITIEVPGHDRARIVINNDSLGAGEAGALQINGNTSYIDIDAEL